ncbi:MAG: hypothetical protein Tsb0014_34820 [Pleurocapsa sp.]
MPEYPQSYSPDDIQEILALAIARKGESEELTRQQLWEIAGELNIDVRSVQLAEENWLQQKERDRKRVAFDLYRRSQFKDKFTKYLIVNIFLVSLNLFTAGAITWSLYVLLFWGLGLALNGWKTYQSQGEEYEKAFQRWSFQNEVKQTVSSIWTQIQKALQA